VALVNKETLSEQQIAEIKINFDFFDRDGNGRIELTEFIELLTALAPKTKASHVEEGFKLIDTNNDGYIDFIEFVDWWQDCWWEY
jgi:Ca2+-binding EF-hand superfamily protein